MTIKNFEHLDLNRELRSGDYVVLPGGKSCIMGRVQRVGVVYAYVFFNRRDIVTPVEKRLLLRISNPENIIESDFCSVHPYEFLRNIVET